MKMSRCLICETKIKPFMSYGEMPLGNGFLLPEHFSDEYFFEMEVAFCDTCKMFQLTQQPDEEQMFHDNYAFFSGTSLFMEQHFKKFAKSVIQDYLPEDPFVVELGSNDGIMLKNFANRNIRHLGVEPSKNVAEVAREKGIECITEFFNEALAQKIVKEKGQADAFLAANVMCHIPYLHSVVKGIATLLKPTGVAQFEDPYLGDVVEKTSYDQIYDEHTFLFSATSIKHLFAVHGLELIDVIHQETHGGSMRYVLSHKGARAVLDSVKNQLDFEKSLKLDQPPSYLQFKQNCECSRDELVSLLKDLKSKGKRVVGYGATSKSTTILNYCGIGPDLIEFICDTTPIKQGKFTPGSHIPVKPYDDFQCNYPEYALLFAWNHSKEIMAKEQAFIESGGKWIVFVPKVEVLD
jgi:methylation protein EvaC